jgi:hypothetical protein
MTLKKLPIYNESGHLTTEFRELWDIYLALNSDLDLFSWLRENKISIEKRGIYSVQVVFESEQHYFQFVLKYS